MLGINRGKIGLEDLQIGTGTFQRTGPTGALETLHQLGLNQLGMISPGRTVVDHGNPLEVGSIAYYHAASINLLLLEKGVDYPFLTSYAFPRGAVTVNSGGTISPAVGVTVTITPSSYHGSKGTNFGGAGSVVLDVAWLEWFGGGIDIADNAAALVAAYGALSLYGVICYCPGKYTFETPVVLASNKHESHMGQGTIWEYTGADNDTDIWIWGDNVTQQRGISIDDITFQSATTMLGHTGVVFKQITRSNLTRVKFDHQDGTGKFYHGVWFQGFDMVNVAFFQARAAFDAVRCNGAATAANYPKADLYFLQGKIGKSTNGAHIGGGAGGVHFEQVGIINNATNVLIDQLLLSELGMTLAPNREITFGAACAIDSACTTNDAATFDGINVDIQDTAGHIFFKETWNASAGTLIRVGTNFLGFIKIVGGNLYNAFNTYGGNGYGIDFQGVGSHTRVTGVMVRNVDGAVFIGTNALPSENLFIEGCTFEDDVSGDLIVNVRAKCVGQKGKLEVPVPLAVSTSPRKVSLMGLDGSNAEGIAYFGDHVSAAWLELAKSRSDIIGVYTAVQSGDALGGIMFSAADGVEFIEGCYMRGVVGTFTGAGNLSTRLEFFTRPTGGATPLMGLQLDENGRVYVKTMTAFADNAAAVAGGLVVGQLYRITGTDQVGVVH